MRTEGKRGATAIIASDGNQAPNNSAQPIRLDIGVGSLRLTNRIGSLGRPAPMFGWKMNVLSGG